MSRCPTGEAVIFDMDGVIVDSESRHARAFLETFQAIGFADHRLTLTDYIGRTDRDVWVDFIKQHQPPHTMDELAALKRGRILRLLERDQPLYPGLPELVRALAPAYRLALASGSERMVVDAVLALGGLRSAFPVTVSASEITRGKPDPEIFLAAAAQLGVAPARCWVIEDSKPGIAAARAAGMRVIAITNTHPAAELTQATRVVSNYEEIAALLLGSG